MLFELGLCSVFCIIYFTKQLITCTNSQEEPGIMQSDNSTILIQNNALQYVHTWERFFSYKPDKDLKLLCLWNDMHYS